MAKIIPFPAKFIPPRVVNSTGKSDMQHTIDRLITVTRRDGRSQGFMIGILVANITNIIVQYFLK